MEEEEALAESMRVAAYAIGDYMDAVTFEVALRKFDYSTIARLATKVKKIYNQYRTEE